MGVQWQGGGGETAAAMSAPTLSAADEAAELRAELEATKAELAATQRKLAAATGAPAPAKPVIDRGSPGWAERIPFHDPGWGEEGGRSFGMNRLRGVGARLKGITSQRDLIVPSTDRPELPQPTADEAQLERDFLKWGYCLVADAMSPEQVGVAAERLWDQASAEVAAGTPPPRVATAPPLRLTAPRDRCKGVVTGVHPGGASPGAGQTSQLVMSMVNKASLTLRARCRLPMVGPLTQSLVPSAGRRVPRRHRV